MIGHKFLKCLRSSPVLASVWSARQRRRVFLGLPYPQLALLPLGRLSVEDTLMWKPRLVRCRIEIIPQYGIFVWLVSLAFFFLFLNHKPLLGD